MNTKKFFTHLCAPVLGLFLIANTTVAENIDWSASSMSSVNENTIRIYNLGFAPTPGISYNVDFIFNEATLKFEPDASSLETVDSQKFEAASVTHGGRLYDSWWRANGETEPTGIYALYPQNVGSQTGSTTWRCKECHGWDYKGKDGAYGNGSDHFTGIAGVFHMQNKPAAEIYSVIKHKNLPLSEEDIWDLTRFIKEGLIDMDKYIVFTGALSKTATGTRNTGVLIYSSRCFDCHGPDGKAISGVTVGTIANDNPWEVLHKIAFGNPGTSMPSMIDNGLSTQQLIDLLTHAQTLPQE